MMQQKSKIIDVALGRTPGDLAIVNARLLNVYTGEIIDHQSVCTCGERIAYVGPDAGTSIGNDTRVIDAGGATLIPGLIDGHAHLAWLFSPGTFLQHAARGGTTTVVTETLEVFPVGGVAGVLDFLASLKGQPIRFYATVPPMVSISRAANGIDKADLEQLLSPEEVVGLGESYWQSILQDADTFLPIFEQALSHGKKLEGHTAGAKGGKLQAYTACGISSCHEPIKTEEVLERLRLGIYVMVREGSVRRDLSRIATIKDLNIDTRRLILTTDGVSPSDLLEMGYMEYVVQKAIDCGFNPIAAVQMATLNVAEHFGLDDRVGGIAPGKYADMVLIPDPQTIKAILVICNGRVVARDGHLEQPVRKHSFAGQSLNSIRLPETVTPSDFFISPPGDSPTANVRVIEMVTDLVTRELLMERPIVDRRINVDVENDLLKVAAMDRTKFPGKCFTGLIKGFGMKSGAIASSAAWDTSCIIVVGTNEIDMALCVNRIRELQGGAVICADGCVVAEIPMPVFGIISELPLEELVNRIAALRTAAHELGVRFPDPLLTIVTLTGAAIPYLRICEEGLVNLKDGRMLGLIAG